MSLNRPQFLLFSSLISCGFLGLDITKRFWPTSDVFPHKSRLVDSAIASIPNSKPRFRFIAIGDAGTGEKGQYEVANALFWSYQKHPFQVVTLLGDNIYIDGEIDKINEVFEKPYQSFPYWWVID